MIKRSAAMTRVAESRAPREGDSFKCA